MKKVLPLLIVIGLFLIGYFSTSIIINKNRKEYKKNNINNNRYFMCHIFIIWSIVA